MVDPAWEPAEDPRESEPPNALQVVFDLTLPRIVDAAQPLAALSCGLCANMNVHQAWRHVHEPEGPHWHHCIDPGDGLPSPCGASLLFERLRAALIDELVGRGGDGRDLE